MIYNVYVYYLFILGLCKILKNILKKFSCLHQICCCILHIAYSRTTWKILFKNYWKKYSAHLCKTSLVCQGSSLSMAVCVITDVSLDKCVLKSRSQGILPSQSDLIIYILFLRRCISFVLRKFFINKSVSLCHIQRLSCIVVSPWLRVSSISGRIFVSRICALSDRVSLTQCTCESVHLEHL